MMMMRMMVLVMLMVMVIAVMMMMNTQLIAKVSTSPDGKKRSHRASV